MTQRNRQIRLARRPQGIPQAEHFEIVETAIPELADRQILVRNQYLSVEPAMRGWVNAGPGYAKPVGIGEVMRAFTAGEVVASKNPKFAPGDKVTGMLGWQEYTVCEASAISRKVREDDLPLSLSLGILGINGLTAYFALFEVGGPRPGDTIVVSTAAGAVGSAVGQLAKIAGCCTVGIAGGPVKTALCRSDFGYDVAIDYKAGGLLEAAVREACPSGIDIYFDNTSGAISDIAMGQLSIGARVIVCGTASVASWDPPPLSARLDRMILTRRVRMQGFLVFDYQHRYEDAIGRLAGLVRAGRLKYREDILDGIESCPDAVAGLYRGENLGKRLIRLS